MRTLSYDLSLIQYKDLIRMQDRTDTLCHNDHRFILYFRSQFFSQFGIRFHIQC